MPRAVLTVHLDEQTLLRPDGRLAVLIRMTSGGREGWTLCEVEGDDAEGLRVATRQSRWRDAREK